MSPATPATVSREHDTSSPYDPSLPWRLHPHVSLRPEEFGALAYHFGTRRLSFVKSRTLLAILQSLDDQSSARDACLAAGVPTSELDTYDRALETLVRTDMICRREEP
jgi:putative mycofactocin binding protein MftB